MHTYRGEMAAIVGGTPGRRGHTPMASNLNQLTVHPLGEAGLAGRQRVGENQNRRGLMRCVVLLNTVTGLAVHGEIILHQCEVTASRGLYHFLPLAALG